MYIFICIYNLETTFQWFVPLQQEDFSCCISKVVQYLFT
jgi:hypothetical protein